MKLEYQLTSKGICVDQVTNDGLSSLISTYGNETIKGQKEESFLSIFWKQQLDALSVKTKRQVWWHPLIIRWALYIHHRSSGAYETLWKSSAIALPVIQNTTGLQAFIDILTWVQCHCRHTATRVQNRFVIQA